MVVLKLSYNLSIFGLFMTTYKFSSEYNCIFITVNGTKYKLLLHFTFFICKKKNENIKIINLFSLIQSYAISNKIH